MTRCRQPGCSGEVVDGYCMVCGMPGEAPADEQSETVATQVPAEIPTAMAGPGAPCTQPGCSGRIADGYCTVCGAPAGSDPLESSTAAPHEHSPMSGEVSVATAAGIGSAAIGSARAKDSGVTKRVRSGSERMRAARLGAGLTNVPAAPPVD
ncbi:MAG: serine/threonine protein kinase, partial [Dermatophilaceae bacterium]